MVSVQLCVDGEGKPRDITAPHEVRTILEDDRAVVWLNVARSGAQLGELGERFGFHGLAIEDATDENERPKATIYRDHVFVLLYALAYKTGNVITTPIGIFVGKNYLVTVTDQPTAEFDEVSHRWHEFSDVIADRTAGSLAYALIDAIVDGYFPVIDQISERLERLETGLIERTLHNPQQIIHDTRTQLIQLRRVVSPEREAINTLLRRDVPVFDDHVSEYMDDVYDHILRAIDWIDTYRDLLSNLSDLQFSVNSHKLNQTMRTMTAWSIIFMAVTLIASIYGMNFDHMPELHLLLGYPAALLGMVIIGGGIFVFFHRREWL
ncbi:MAG TPA: magnesium/cobalt transporter CorA [Thermomicrobiales bacterium]|nr:magnesium/cobalt transporter CorA [Thermomicrobiales bacterium]